MNIVDVTRIFMCALLRSQRAQQPQRAYRNGHFERSGGGGDRFRGARARERRVVRTGGREGERMKGKKNRRRQVYGVTAAAAAYDVQ